MTNTKPKAFIFDCDEVLLDWPKAFITYHNNTYGTDLAHEDYKGTLTEAFGIDEELVNQRMYEFNEHAWQFGQLTPFGEAKWLMRIIKAYNFIHSDDPIHIIVVTKCGSAETTKMMRMNNLVTQFGDVFDGVHYLTLHDSKAPIVEQICKTYDVRLFIDDYIKNCKEVKAACPHIEVHSIRTPHNKHIIQPAGVTIHKNWPSLILAVTDLLE